MRKNKLEQQLTAMKQQQLEQQFRTTITVKTTAYRTTVKTNKLEQQLTVIKQQKLEQ